MLLTYNSHGTEVHRTADGSLPVPARNWFALKMSMFAVIHWLAGWGGGMQRISKDLTLGMRQFGKTSFGPVYSQPLSSNHEIIKPIPGAGLAHSILPFVSKSTGTGLQYIPFVTCRQGRGFFSFDMVRHSSPGLCRPVRGRLVDSRHWYRMYRVRRSNSDMVAES